MGPWDALTCSQRVPARQTASLGYRRSLVLIQQATLRELHLDTDGFAFGSADLWNLTHFKQLVVLNVVVGPQVNPPCVSLPQLFTSPDDSPCKGHQRNLLTRRRYIIWTEARPCFCSASTTH